MSVIWSKIRRDLVHNRARTVLVVLSTAVGVFALGLVFGLSGVLRARIMESYRASKPAHITFWGGPFSPKTIDALWREPGVASAEGETTASFRWKLEGEAGWRDGNLIARDNYSEQHMNLLRLQDGRWPDEQSVHSSAVRSLSIERLSAQHFNIPLGTDILVEFGKRERRVPIEGVLSAPVVLPPEWGGDAMFFATPETASWLTGSEQGEGFNRLHVLLESYSEEAARGTAKRIEARLERTQSEPHHPPPDLLVGGYEVADPNTHWVQDIVDATMMILMVIGGLALGLSAFLIINTMSAMLLQQVWQIGVMKAIGATFSHVVRLYLAMALIYGTLALLLAVPLGALGAHLLAVWLLNTFNVDLVTFQISPAAITIQAAVGVAVPLLAAAIPVTGGARITVHRAIATYGLGGDFGGGWLDRLIARIHHLPRPLALSLRNTFRRTARVSLTLATLIFSGAMFTIVLSTGASLDNTIATPTASPSARTSPSHWIAHAPYHR